MDSLYKLSKQMDALTYNARNVVNALIRSTMTAGSYNGYTVSRAGKEIKLSRVDIYRLYTFYQEWEYHYSFQKSDFDDLRTTHDAKYLRVAEDTDNTTEALIKHSQILYLTPENVAEFANGDFWLNLLRENANPKQIANSCPIPLNLRTPIYDENLSTKHFSQFESYLFPSGYYAMNLLGYYNDAVDHIGGGKSWTWEVNNKFTVQADSTIIGYQNPDLKNIKEAPMVSVDKPAYRVMTGLECYAYGTHAFAGGEYSTAYGGNTFSFGNRNLAIYGSSAVLGGYNNIAGDNNAATVGGEWNRAIARDSFAANYKACVGGAQWFFKKLLIETAADTDTTNPTKCPPVIFDNGCVYASAVHENGVPVSQPIVSISHNVIYITYDEVGGRNLPGNSGESVYKTDHLDFQAGDEIMLYGFRANTPGYAINYSSGSTTYARFYGDGNRGTTGIITKVTSITKNDSKKRFEIVLDKDVLIDGIDITAGYATLYTAHRHISTMMQDGVAETTTIAIHAGYASTALNYYTRAVGPDQTVVGSMNEPMFEPRFIVGSGARLADHEDKNAGSNNHRRYHYGPGNSFVSGPRYSYMKVHNSKIVVGVSDVTNAENGVYHTTEKIVSDESAKLGVYMLSGAYSMVWNDSKSQAGINRVDENRAQLTVSDADGDTGIIIHNIEYNPSTKMYGGNAPEVHDKHISTLIGSTKGSTVIYSGKDPDYPNNKCFYDRFKYGGENYAVPVNHVAVYAEDGITLDTTGTIYMQAVKYDNSKTSYIDMFFEELKLSGDTYGALTGTCDARSYNIYKDNRSSNSKWMTHNRISHSGFFFNWVEDGMDNHGLPEDMTYYINCDGYHSLCSAYVYSTDNSHYKGLMAASKATTQSSIAYDTSTLILPGAINYETYKQGTPHIHFVSNTIYGDGNGGAEPSGPMIKETLAYMSDLDTFWKHSESISMAAGFATNDIGYDSSNNLVVRDDGIPFYFIDNSQKIKSSVWCSGVWDNTFGSCLGSKSGKFSYVRQLRCSLAGNQYNITGEVCLPKGGKHGAPTASSGNNHYYGIVFSFFPTFKVDSSVYQIDGNDYAVYCNTIYGRMYYNYDSTAAAKFHTSNGMVTVCIQWTDGTNNAIAATTGNDWLSFPFALSGTVPFKSAELYHQASLSSTTMQTYWASESGKGRIWKPVDIVKIWGLSF